MNASKTVKSLSTVYSTVNNPPSLPIFLLLTVLATSHPQLQHCHQNTKIFLILNRAVNNWLVKAWTQSWARVP